MKLSKTFVAVSAVLLSGSINAGSVNTTLDITANLVDACSVSVTQDVDFGDFTELMTAADGTFNIDVNCTTGGSYDITLDVGANPNLTDQREVVNGASNTVYFLYQPGGFSTQWGDTGFGGTTQAAATPVSGTGTGSVQTYTGNARIAPQNGNSSLTVNGSHTDTVQVTVHY